MMKFFYYNLVQLPGTIVTASNEDAFFPVTNLKDNRRTKVFRSSSASVSIDFDFLSQINADSFLMVPHTKNGWQFNGTITLKADPSGNFASPAFSVVIGPGDISEDFLIAKKYFSTVTARYWRVELTGTSFVEVGKIFIGESKTVGDRSIGYDWDYRNNDLSVVSQNRYGQKFTDILFRQKTISFSFDYLSKNDVDCVNEVVDYVSKTTPFFIDFDLNNSTNENERFTGYYFFDDIPSISNPVFARYNVSLSVTEGT